MIIKESDLIKAVKQGKSIVDVCLYLNMKPNGGNRRTINKWIKEYNLDISHFANTKKYGRKSNYPLQYYLYYSHKFTNRHLKQKLLELGYFKNQCYYCYVKAKSLYLIKNKNNFRLVCKQCYYKPNEDRVIDELF